MPRALDDVGVPEHDATELAARVRSRSLPARRLVEDTLQRIAAVDRQVNAFRVVTAESALMEADRIDVLSDVELTDLALAGVPLAVKDDTDVAGLSTMWGTAVDRGVCDRDAVVVERLRRAGAIIIGKTNVPELTLWPWTSSETWGTTRNPWDLDRTPGGSSGGSAAAVAAGMAAIALGSDGGGSIRYPAGLNGLIGLKPQRGRIPIGAEHGSAWNGLVTLGPITRSVRDAALFLDTVTDNGTQFREAIAGPPAPLHIAVAVNPPAGSNVTLGPAGRRQIDHIAHQLADLGHTMIEIDIDYPLAALWNSTVRLLRGASDDIRALPDTHRLEARTRANARIGRLFPARTLRRALDREDQIAITINCVMDDADIVLTPLCAAPAPRIDDCPRSGALRSLRHANTSAWLVPFNLTGQPAISVPTGTDIGLPTAIQLVARPNDEATLLRLAAQLEAALAR